MFDCIQFGTNADLVCFTSTKNMSKGHQIPVAYVWMSCGVCEDLGGKR